MPGRFVDHQSSLSGYKNIIKDIAKRDTARKVTSKYLKKLMREKLLSD